MLEKSRVQRYIKIIKSVSVRLTYISRVKSAAHESIKNRKRHTGTNDYVRMGGEELCFLMLRKVVTHKSSLLTVHLTKKSS